MTLQDFINKYNGKHIDFDGAYGAQCMDLYRYYVQEVWQLPKTPSVKGAFQVFDTLDPLVYEKVKARTGQLPEVGDVITWSEAYTENGHIAVVTEANAGNFHSFDQNNPKDAPCKITTHNYGKSIIGWFRPKINNNNDMKLPLIKFDDSNTVYLQAGVSLFPFDSAESLTHAGGSFDDVVPVSASQRGKYDIRMESL